MASLISAAPAVNLPELLSELVDETALDKPLAWEALDYEATKRIAIAHSIELCQAQPHTQHTIELMAILAYLLMENTQLWAENLQLHRGHAGPAH